MKTPLVLTAAGGKVDPFVNATDVSDTILGQIRPARDSTRRAKTLGVLIGGVLPQPRVNDVLVPSHKAPITK